MGSLAAGAAAATGTGAFSQVDANRDIEVAVAGDQNAYLGLKAGNNGYVDYDDTTGAIELLFDDNSSAQGTGLNNRADTEVEDAFSIINQSDRDLYVWVRGPAPASGAARSLELVADGSSAEPHSAVDITFPYGEDKDDYNEPGVSFDPVQGGFLKLTTGEESKIDIRWLVAGSLGPRDFDGAELQFTARSVNEHSFPTDLEDYTNTDLNTGTVTTRTPNS